MSDPTLVPPCNRRYEEGTAPPEGASVRPRHRRQGPGDGGRPDAPGGSAPASVSQEEIRQLDEASVDICFSRLADLLDSAV